MALKEYHRKRHFDRTPEPRGAAPRQATGRAFVVQKHDASHLHYDFRLEMGGVLKSWAVPKGPSMDPADKSLAIEVEDHPVEYGGFEGTIPEGQYGGGTVMLWDRGTWELDPVAGTTPNPIAAWRAGKLHFTLNGEKLKGKWLLVKMKPRRPGDKNHWLLRKGDDKFARPKSKFDVLDEDRSVTTGRSMEDIASAADRSWESDRACKGGRRSRRKKAGDPAPPRVIASATAGQEAQSGPDVASLLGAKKAPLPRSIEPELCTLVDKAPTGDDWIHEVKFDGYRILAIVTRRGVRLLSRNGKDWTSNFSQIAKAVADRGMESAIVDGEVVATDANGVTSFQALQNRLKKGGTGLAYQVFDLPYFAGYDLRGCTLEDRRAVLRTLVRDASQTSSPVRFSEAIKGNGDGVFQNACKLGLEGIVSKRLGSTYVGQRTRDWVKTKCTSRQEMVIGGYTDPQRTRTAFGALLLGYYRENEFVYAGKVGTGFDERTLKDVLARLRPLERPDAPFAHPPRGYEAKGAHWVSPKLVCEVEFTEWTGDGHLRHPSFAGLREDKDPREVVREHSRRTPRAEKNPEMNGTPHKGRRGRRSAVEEPNRPDARAARSRRSRPSPSGGDEEARVLGVQLTHPDKVLYPESGITKRALAEYYAAIGDRMLPSIAGRPLMLVRCPEGRRATCFHQKNWDVELGPGSHGLIIKEQTTSNRYIIVDKPAGLVWLVQRGVLEIHDWGSTEKDLEHPDRLVFDLDPGPGVEWPEVVEGAVLVRDTLEEIGLKSWVKTTGGKGLHVVAPLRPKADWAHVKQFAMALAQAIAQKQPGKYVANMSKARRNGKIYVDYLRNARGATSVAAYSTRSRPGSPVSVPLSWKELAATKARPSFGLREVVARARKPDPWADMKKIRQSLKG